MKRDHWPFLSFLSQFLIMSHILDTFSTRWDCNALAMERLWLFVLFVFTFWWKCCSKMCSLWDKRNTQLSILTIVPAFHSGCVCSLLCLLLSLFSICYHLLKYLLVYVFTFNCCCWYCYFSTLAVCATVAWTPSPKGRSIPGRRVSWIEQSQPRLFSSQSTHS